MTQTKKLRICSAQIFTLVSLCAHRHLGELGLGARKAEPHLAISIRTVLDLYRLDRVLQG